MESPTSLKSNFVLLIKPNFHEQPGEHKDGIFEVCPENGNLISLIYFLVGNIAICEKIKQNAFAPLLDIYIYFLNVAASFV